MPVGLAKREANKSNVFIRFPIAFEWGVWGREHKTGWVKERQLQKNKNIFTCFWAMVKKVVALIVPVLLFPSSWVHKRKKTK